MLRRVVILSVFAGFGISAGGCASTCPSPRAATPSEVVAPGDDGWVSIPSIHDVATTVARLEATIAARGAVHFASIDHGAGAVSVGETLGPMVLVIFGNPKVGTKLMTADPRVGSELPLRMLVHADEARQTFIGFRSPLGLVSRYELKSVADVLGAMDKSMRGLAAAAAAVD